MSKLKAMSRFISISIVFVVFMTVACQLLLFSNRCRGMPSLYIVIISVAR
jgi:hypothetical protein